MGRASGECRGGLSTLCILVLCNCLLILEQSGYGEVSKWMLLVGGAPAGSLGWDCSTPSAWTPE